MTLIPRINSNPRPYLHRYPVINSENGGQDMGYWGCPSIPPSSAYIYLSAASRFLRANPSPNLRRPYAGSVIFFFPPALGASNTVKFPCVLCKELGNVQPQWATPSLHSYDGTGLVQHLRYERIRYWGPGYYSSDPILNGFDSKSLSGFSLYIDCTLGVMSIGKSSRVSKTSNRNAAKGDFCRITRPWYHHIVLLRCLKGSSLGQQDHKKYGSKSQFP